jgi:ABC-type Fe3+-hydroxamate transport system substrate-binding protein
MKGKNVTIIGGTKNINIEKIKALQPDLILANKEENVKEQVEALMEDLRL